MSLSTWLGDITVGYHPTGMALWGKYLLVANTYSDSLSVIDTTSNQEVRKIDLGLPISVPGDPEPAYGAGPVSVAVDAGSSIAYVALYNANAVAVVDLNALSWSPVVGVIPVGYAPASVVLDEKDNALLVANDKGVGTTGFGVKPPPPNLMKYAVQNCPQFDLGIPDQYRVDVWKQDFEKDVKNDCVPQLEFMWISSDHTGGPPNATAMQADNDLALGRFVDIISHSPIWGSSVIFVEEDDAQTGVDHVDGHRSPGYVISPYVKQNVKPDGKGGGVTADSTFYTQVNMTRTIE